MMDEYSSMLVGICAILLDDRDLAQDVVQETFIRVYKKMDSFRGARPESEKAWLTRIAVNPCRDEKRKSWFRLRERAKPIDMTAIPMETRRRRHGSCTRPCRRCRRNTARLSCCITIRI